MEEMETDFSEFFNAFDGGEGGNQTEAEAEQEEVQENTEEPAAEEQEQDEAAEAEETGSEEEATEPDSEEEKPAAEEQTFTIKVNKEDRQVSLAEMTALAQKGADYDRVKEQVAESKKSNEALSKQLADQSEVYDLIAEIAKDQGVSIPDFLTNVQVTRLMEKENISEDVARERVARLEAEAKLKAFEKKPAEKSDEAKLQERFDKDMKVFQELYPDVDISSLPTEELKPDIQAGMSITQAYQKYERAKLEAERKELEAQRNADAQNKKNRKHSPGSVGDSSSKKQHDPIDDFWSAFS